MMVYDDGSGAGRQLYVTGNFSTVGGAPINGLARWNGQAWSSVGGPPSAYVSQMAVYDDGRAGPALFVTGGFNTIGGVSALRIARWDGHSWSPLGSGLSGGTGETFGLAVFDDGRGPALYVGGRFTGAGGVPVTGLARWDVASWSAVPGAGQTGITALHTYTPPNGGPTRLYAGGDFSLGEPRTRLAMFDGTSWSRLSDHYVYSVFAFREFDDGNGRALYMAGYSSPGTPADWGGVGRWDGTTFTPLGRGVFGGNESSAAAGALVGFNDGRSTALYVAGGFRFAGTEPAAGIARWDGTAWHALGSGLPDGHVICLEVFDDGTGPALYAGGYFYLPPQRVGGRLVYLAKYNPDCAGPCPADYDNNGVRTPDDFGNWRSEFWEGHIVADVNRDGAVNVKDLFDLLQAYSAGCP
jgi:trimeric autotransporter adhesin